MNLTNYHSHSTFSDGHAPLEAFVESAIAKGFYSVGFSEHAPLPYHTRWNMDAERMNDYLAKVDYLRTAYSGQIELYAGLEIDYLTADYNPSICYFRNLPLDFRIGSVHTIPNDDGELYEIDCSIDRFRDIVDNVFSGDIEYVMRLFLQRLKAMAECGGFDIVGHADKMHALADAIKPQLSSQIWYKQLIADCLDIIAQKGYIMEVNTKKYGVNGLFFPDVSLWPLMLELGIRITVSSDAHYPENIDSGRYYALLQLQKAGFSTHAELHDGHWCDVPINLTMKKNVL